MNQESDNGTVNILNCKGTAIELTEQETNGYISITVTTTSNPYYYLVLNQYNGNRIKLCIAYLLLEIK